MAGWTCALRRGAVIAVVAFVPVPSAHGVDHTVGGGKLTVTGSAYLGTAIRTDEQDPKLLASVNSTLVGIAGNAVTPSSGRNGDDGNLNFSRGDAVATVLKGYLALAYRWRHYGIEASERLGRVCAFEVVWCHAGQPVWPWPSRARRGVRRLEARLAGARLG
jgi:hypothetical protein